MNIFVRKKHLVAILALGLIPSRVLNAAQKAHGGSQASQGEEEVSTHGTDPAAKPAEGHGGTSGRNASAAARNALANIIEDNDKFTKKHNAQCFEPFLAKQTPRATVVMCSDSRYHTYSFDETPDNDLFMIRNIGNQIASTEGSVEYGIRHLGTSLLLILGHSGCGAVKAALEGTQLEPAIKKEVSSIHLSKKNVHNPTPEAWLRGVRENVNNQVAFALKKFEKEVKEEKLVVVGAFFDLHDQSGQSNGRIIVLNVNGKTDPLAIEKFVPFQGLHIPTL